MLIGDLFSQMLVENASLNQIIYIPLARRTRRYTMGCLSVRIQTPPSISKGIPSAYRQLLCTPYTLTAHNFLCVLMIWVDS